jgi:hypothetical protein
MEDRISDKPRLHGNTYRPMTCVGCTVEHINVWATADYPRTRRLCPLCM